MSSLPIHRVVRALAVLPVLLLSACGTPGTQADLLDNTLRAYANAVRWGDFEAASAFVDPEVQREHPITKEDLDRYLRVHVGSYSDQPFRPSGKNEIKQTVEITIADNNTQTVRSIIDRQVWRFDEKSRHWYLTTGLPKLD